MRIRRLRPLMPPSLPRGSPDTRGRSYSVAGRMGGTSRQAPEQATEAAGAEAPAEAQDPADAKKAGRPARRALALEKEAQQIIRELEQTADGHAGGGVPTLDTLTSLTPSQLKLLAEKCGEQGLDRTHNAIAQSLFWRITQCGGVSFAVVFGETREWTGPSLKPSTAVEACASCCLVKAPRPGGLPSATRRLRSSAAQHMGFPLAEASPFGAAQQMQQPEMQQQHALPSSAPPQQQQQQQSPNAAFAPSQPSAAAPFASAADPFSAHSDPFALVQPCTQPLGAKLGAASHKGDPYAVQTPTAAQADPNAYASTSSGSTALHEATLAERGEVVHALLAAGALASPRGSHGNTPLRPCAASSSGHDPEPCAQLTSNPNPNPSPNPSPNPKPEPNPNTNTNPEPDPTPTPTPNQATPASSTLWPTPTSSRAAGMTTPTMRA